MTLLLQLQACAAKRNALCVAQRQKSDPVRAPPTCTIVKNFGFNSELTDEQLPVSAQNLAQSLCDTFGIKTPTIATRWLHM